MISVIIQCHNQEAELAKTLSALVSGAVEGIISDVSIFDEGSSDGTATVADAAGNLAVGDVGGAVVEGNPIAVLQGQLRKKEHVVLILDEQIAAQSVAPVGLRGRGQRQDGDDGQAGAEASFHGGHNVSFKRVALVGKTHPHWAHATDS